MNGSSLQGLNVVVEEKPYKTHTYAFRASVLGICSNWTLDTALNMCVIIVADDTTTINVIECGFGWWPKARADKVMWSENYSSASVRPNIPNPRANMGQKEMSIHYTF